MTKLEHVHLSELEFDVLLVFLEGTDDLSFVIIGGMSIKLGLNLSNLSLCLVRAVGNLLVQSLEDGDQSINAVHDVIVVSGENRSNSSVEACQEVVVISEAV